MSRGFRIYLISLTVASALVVAVPAFIMVGLTLGFVPGIVLALAPTVLMYSLAWWALQAAILWGAARLGSNAARRVWRWSAGVFAALALVALAIAIPPALNEPDLAASRALRAQDIKPAATPIALPATILYRVNDVVSRDEDACEAVCLRLLYNGAVKKVVTAYACSHCSPPRENAPLAFWIERRDRCEAFNERYGHVSLAFPADRTGPMPGTPQGYVVRARMAAGECVAYGAGDPSEATLTLSLDAYVKRGASTYSCQWCLTESFVKASRLEVIGSTGALLYRRTEVNYKPLVIPLSINPAYSFLTSVTYTGWSRKTQTDTPIGPYGRDVLGDLFGTAVRLPDMPVPAP